MNTPSTQKSTLQSILNTTPYELPNMTQHNETTTNSLSIISYISSITWKTWLIIILLLALLGINIFAYLAKGTQVTSDIFNQLFMPLFKFFGYTALETTKQTITTSATGAKAGIDIITDTTTGTINSIENIPSEKNVSVSSKQDTLNMVLNSALPEEEYKPDDSFSQIQSSNKTGKSGWCFIGDDRGTRACSEVGVNDLCMSGNIFPTQDVCINPNLRA